MMLRMLSAISFTLAGGIVGLAMSDKLRESRRICDEIGYMFRRAAFLVTYRQDDVYMICRSFKSDPELKSLAFLQQLPDCYIVGGNFRELWRTAVESQKNLGREETELLRHFGCILGKSDAEGQAESLSALQKELDCITEVRTENLLKKGKLYRSVGILFGIMAGILVL